MGQNYTVASGAGPRAVGTERGRGVNDNERHLRHSPVPRVPRRSSEGIKGGVTTVEGERTRPGLLVCVLCAAVVREGLPLFICVCLFCY